MSARIGKSDFLSSSFGPKSQQIKRTIAGLTDVDKDAGASLGFCGKGQRAGFSAQRDDPDSNRSGQRAYTNARSSAIALTESGTPVYSATLWGKPAAKPTVAGAPTSDRVAQNGRFHAAKF
jgi:hypothetical protein